LLNDKFQSCSVKLVHGEAFGDLTMVRSCCMRYCL